ncbi:hypothetical protein CAPTEDRAFT_187432 [Capitella teleta]|uniref:Endonuclease/exonuclease/phosphatase domain-containing protein n=1 Tax=Capitella teleta TaxID=283909 RepID=R7VBS8_CAPTE|nr:hypothetical protein CAPTEDRAFT_187432 [Capitella teleta]|eukprot:ELU16084.1 hypothetical protein CAPTEDRAFT_187432 [Capitella teleta]
MVKLPVATRILPSVRNTLWEECDNDILPKLQKRQNISQMKGSLLTVGDLIEDLIKSLDKADKLPYFAVEFNKLHRISLSKPCETSSISICERLSKLEARMAANENLCAENNCCIARKSPARPSTERPISQPATHHHNDANKTRMPERREFIGGRPFGGVAFLWHRSLAASTKIVRCENNRLCAIYITMDTTTVLLVNAYFPCDNHSKTSVDAEYQAALDSALCLWIESDADVIILGGDLNTDISRNNAHSHALNQLAHNMNSDLA